MASPNVKTVRDAEASQQKNPDLSNNFTLTDGPGRDRSVRFVDCVDFLVVPIVDGLGETYIDCEERECARIGSADMYGITQTNL